MAYMYSQYVPRQSTIFNMFEMYYYCLQSYLILPACKMKILLLKHIHIFRTSGGTFRCSRGHKLDMTRRSPTASLRSLSAGVSVHSERSPPVEPPASFRNFLDTKPAIRLWAVLRSGGSSVIHVSRAGVPSSGFCFENT